jgi:hypothetical protein
MNLIDKIVIEAFIGKASSFHRSMLPASGGVQQRHDTLDNIFKHSTVQTASQLVTRRSSAIYILRSSIRQHTIPHIHCILLV